MFSSDLGKMVEKKYLDKDEDGLEKSISKIKI